MSLRILRGYKTSPVLLSCWPIGTNKYRLLILLLYYIIVNLSFYDAPIIDITSTALPRNSFVLMGAGCCPASLP